MLLLKLITSILSMSFCCAIQQQLIIYANTNCTGNGLIFETKESDVTYWAPHIMSTSLSMSTIGCWGVYNSTNYAKHSYGWRYGCYESRYCYNYPYGQSAKSVRYFGPPDTTTPSISFYESEYALGREVTVAGLASANIPFTPESFMTTGQKSWTLYSGSDFNGTSICFTPQTNNWYHAISSVNASMLYVRSVYRGCNRPIDFYVYGDNLILH